jgi:hypothetical protein
VLSLATCGALQRTVPVHFEPQDARGIGNVLDRFTGEKHAPEHSALNARYFRIGRGAVALVAVGIVAAFAFANLFTTFILWDDEGYFLKAYRDFLSGRVLYDQVFAIYGPFTFWTAALIARFDAANVTHDTFRWVLLPVWIAVAALMGGLVWRWTHRFIPSVVTLLLVGLHLRGLAKGIGHPQSWIILATAVLLWLGLESGSQNVRKRRAFAAGVIIAAILLFKINIGILVLIGLALPMSLLMKGPMRTLLCALLTLAASAIGIALFFWSPTISEKCFALIYMASLAATLGIAIRRPVEGQPSMTSLKWLGAGLALCVCIVLGATLAGGTTLRALYSAYVTMPSLLARNYHGPFLDATRKGSILICVIGLAAAVAVFRWRPHAEARPAWLGLLKATAGVGLLCAFCYDHRLALPGSLLFLWLLIVDVPPLSGPAYSNRLMLALLSPLFSLQLVPMAGEQVDWAALLPITAAAVLLADGMNYMGREDSRMALPRLTGFVTSAIAILLTTYLFSFVAGDAIKRVRFWRNSPSVNLQGAHWLRLPQKETERLTLTVSGITQNCQTVLMVPGLYSFSIWSGVPPFEEKRINSWPFLWPEDVRNNELRKLRDQPQGCVLVSKDAYKFFKHFGGSQRTDEPLLPEIQQTMKPIYSVQDVTLYRFLR